MSSQITPKKDCGNAARSSHNGSAIKWAAVDIGVPADNNSETLSNASHKSMTTSAEEFESAPSNSTKKITAPESGESATMSASRKSSRASRLLNCLKTPFKRGKTKKKDIAAVGHSAAHNDIRTDAVAVSQSEELDRSERVASSDSMQQDQLKNPAVPIVQTDSNKKESTQSMVVDTGAGSSAIGIVDTGADSSAIGIVDTGADSSALGIVATGLNSSALGIVATGADSSAVGGVATGADNSAHGSNVAEEDPSDYSLISSDSSDVFKNW